jgi:uncharacterized membrane protein
MKKLISEKTYHFLFEISVIIKAAITAVEIVLGILFYSASTQTINALILFIFGSEATEQPRDFLWNYLIQTFQGLIGPNQSFWAFIFLFHGIVKLFLTVALLKHKLWAYPASAAVFTLFVVYQAYSLFYIHSLFLLLFTIFDVLLIVLILHEYQHKRRIIAA